MEFQRRIEKWYYVYAPEKLEKGASAAKKWLHHREAVFKKLSHLYGPEPSVVEAAAARTALEVQKQSSIADASASLPARSPPDPQRLLLQQFAEKPVSDVFAGLPTLSLNPASHFDNSMLHQRLYAAMRCTEEGSSFQINKKHLDLDHYEVKTRNPSLWEPVPLVATHYRFGVPGWWQSSLFKYHSSRYRFRNTNPFMHHTKLFKIDV